MTQPSVCAILLTKDRPAMAKRAIESFRAQMYQNMRLYVYDSGEVPAVAALPDSYPDFGIIYHRTLSNGRSIGALRNDAIGWACTGIVPPEIIVHWDDDDWSHPNRITEQVELLQDSGAAIVGYSELLFWRDYVTPDSECTCESDPNGECVPKQAWLWYAHTSLTSPPGASLMYWRKTWEERPFADVNLGEDYQFCRGRHYVAISGAHAPLIEIPGQPKPTGWIAGSVGAEPRMICGIHVAISGAHGGNTSNYAKLDEENGKPGSNWKRVAEFDSWCAEKMTL